MSLKSEDILVYAALKFDKHPYVEQIDFISGNNSIIKKRYFVKVKVKKGSGTESCESTIDIKAKDKRIHHRGLWDTGEYNTSIVTERKIKLFETQDNDKIFFNNIEAPYRQFSNGKLKVTIGALDADKPRPYSKKISEIIKQAKEENSF